MSKKLQIVDSLTKQVDWNINDENDATYIKNKPDLTVYASANDVSNLSTLVGDTAVAEQISNAMADVASMTFHTLRFPVSGWVQSDDGTYIQQVSVDGMTADHNGHIDVDMSAATVDTANSIQNAWAKIGRAQSVDGGVKLTCYGEAPNIDITVKLEVIT